MGNFSGDVRHCLSSITEIVNGDTYYSVDLCLALMCCGNVIMVAEIHSGFSERAYKYWIKLGVEKVTPSLRPRRQEPLSPRYKLSPCDFL